MQQTIKFNISLPLDYGASLKHIKDKSFYNHNFYQLKQYGDWVDFGEDNNNILLQECFEDENAYSYSFGHFENNRFIRAFGYSCQEDVLDNIKIVEE